MNRKTLAGLGMMFTLSFVLVACRDTKAREENEQLKAHVLQLQKDAGDLGNRIDVLTKENAELKAENERLKKKPPAKRSPKSRHHRSRSKTTPNNNG